MAQNQAVFDIVRDYLAQKEVNRIAPDQDEPAWQEPLLGAARGDDPIFARIKEHIGGFYWTPEQAFNLAFPQAGAKPGELSVISWILPQTAATKAENAREKVYCGRRWAYIRYHGENINLALRRHMVQSLGAMGIQAVAPQLMEQWSQQRSQDYANASTWSERHAAHACGLGTFGLSDGLITPKGKAVRVGSVIARVELEPTPRPYSDHHAYCLWFSHGTCKKCVPRCPVGSLSEKGHDKALCEKHVYQACKSYNQKTYQVDAPACGLCQTGVPCSDGIPSPDQG